MIQFESTITVRYAETDMMGVVYHGSYLPWFEVGRTELLKAHGIPYRQLEEEGFFLPVIEVHVHYRQPARYDDVLTIRTTLKDKPVLRIRLDYEVLRGSELLATGHTIHAFINRASTPVRPPPRFASTMAALFDGRRDA